MGKHINKGFWPDSDPRWNQSSVTIGGGSRRPSNDDVEPEPEPEPLSPRAYMEQLMAMKPQREDFLSEDDFEEAFGYFMGHQGRIISLIQARLKRSPEE